MFFAKEALQHPDDLKKMKLFAWRGTTTRFEIWKAPGSSPCRCRPPRS